MLIADAVRPLRVAKTPLMLSRGGEQMTAGVLDAVQRLSALLGAPVVTTYPHDCFPADDAMAVVRLGYQAMRWR